MSFGRLFVGNVSYDFDEAALTAELAALGIDAKNLCIIRDRETGQAKGFGFFDVEADKVEETINVANNALIGGRPIQVSLATKQPEDRGARPPVRSDRPPAGQPRPSSPPRREAWVWVEDDGPRRRRK